MTRHAAMVRRSKRLGDFIGWWFSWWKGHRPGGTRVSSNSTTASMMPV